MAAALDAKPTPNVAAVIVQLASLSALATAVVGVAPSVSRVHTLATALCPPPPPSLPSSTADAEATDRAQLVADSPRVQILRVRRAPTSPSGVHLVGQLQAENVECADADVVQFQAYVLIDC